MTDRDCSRPELYPGTRQPQGAWLRVTGLMLREHLGPSLAEQEGLLLSAEWGLAPPRDFQ